MIDSLNLQVLTGSDKLVLISSTNSRNKISAIIQNTSDRPFLLNPNASLGFNISKPDSLNIPRTLPFCHNNFPTRHFSTEALISKSNKSQGQIKYASTRDDGSYFEEELQRRSSKIFLRSAPYRVRKPVLTVHYIRPGTCINRPLH